MHKKEKQSGKFVPTHQMGGALSSLLGSMGGGGGTAGLLGSIFGGGKGLGNAAGNKFGDLGSILGMGKDTTGLTSEQKAQTMNAAVGSGLGVAFDAFNTFSDINNSNLTGNQKNMARGDAAVGVGQQVAGMFGPVGSAIGASLGIVNSIGGKLMGTPKALKDFKVNDTVAQSSGFTGVAAGAKDMAGDANSYKNAGLVGKLFGGKNKLVNQAHQINNTQSTVSGLLDGAKKREQTALGSADMLSLRHMNSLYGGNMWNNGSIQFGKEGTKLTEIDCKASDFNKAAKKIKLSKIKFRKVIDLTNKVPSKPSDLPTIKTHAEGGVLTPVNVIADGALHAHKHTLKDDVEHLTDAQITNKGIPVVSIAEGGEITQHAEIERDELILHLALSNKLEELYEEGDEEAMIQAGRILAKELVKNTKDSSNKILKNG